MKCAEIRNFGCRIKDDIYFKNMKTLFIENDLLRVGILLDKGADIFEFLYKPKDLDFIWLSPYGIKKYDEYLLTKNQNIGRFLDFYEGGWQEIFPNGGMHCNYSGAEFGMHDEVSLLRWDYEIIEDTAETVEIKLFVETRLTPFLLEKNLILYKENPTLFIKERIVNKSPVNIHTIWGYHIVYGYPFLDEGCKINVSAGKGLTYNIKGEMDDNIKLNQEFDWPFLQLNNGEKIDLSVIPPNSLESSKFLYLSNLGKGEYEIINNKTNLKIRVIWNKNIMPYLWFWQEFNKSKGYPWYRMSRVFGLELFSADTLGIENAIKKGKALTVKGNSEIDFNLDIAVLEAKR